MTKAECCSNCKHWLKQDELEYVQIPDIKIFNHLQGWCKLTQLNGHEYETEDVSHIQAVAFDVERFDACLKTAPTFYCNSHELNNSQNND